MKILSEVVLFDAHDFDYVKRMTKAGYSPKKIRRWLKNWYSEHVILKNVKKHRELTQAEQIRLKRRK